MLEGPELSTGWHDVLLRGRQSRDKFAAGQTVFLEPHATKATAVSFAETAEEAGEMCLDLQQRLKVASSQKDQACLIVVPVHVDAHWTALVLLREAGSLFHARYFDSLKPASASARGQAVLLLALVTHILGAESVAEAELPATEQLVVQTDAWSCGYHTLARFEEAYRKLRGEGEKRVYKEPEETRIQLNRVV